MILYIFYPRKIKTVIGANPHDNPYNRCSISITRYKPNQPQKTDRIEIDNPEKTSQIYDFIANYRVRKTLDLIDSGYRGEGDFYQVTFYRYGTDSNSVKYLDIFNSNYICLHTKKDTTSMYHFVNEKMDLQKLEELLK